MKKKVLMSSIVTIVLCLTLIAGSTFALFTDKNEINIAVTSGNVDMTAMIANFARYSVKADAAGNIVDEFGGKYVYAGSLDKFANGGTADLNAAGNVLELDRVTPGDKVSFEIAGTNESDVTIQYRYIIECVGDTKLMSGLVVTIDGTSYPVLSKFTSAWMTLEPTAEGEDNSFDSVPVAVELPVTAGNEYQNQATALKITVEAVQGNADVQGNTAVVEFLDGYNATVVSDLASLQAALDSTVEGDNYIVIGADIAGDAVVTQKANTNTIIEGNGHKFEGAITVDGKSATIKSAKLTINNVNFNAASISKDAFINFGGSNDTRYVCNVTISGCTFGGNAEIVGIKSYTGGDYNVSILNCTANADLHSLAQLKGVTGLLIQNCTVNSVRGVSLNNSLDVVIDKCTMNVQKYAVRFGESGNSVVEKYAVTNCNLTSTCEEDAVIVLRAGATNAQLTLTGTTLTGTPDMIGYENATIIR